MWPISFIARKTLLVTLKKWKTKHITYPVLSTWLWISQTKIRGIYTDFLAEIPSFLKACDLVMPLTIIAREHICLHMYKPVYLCLPMPTA